MAKRNRPGSAEEQEARDQSVVRLRHGWNVQSRVFHFYDGQLWVEKGLIEIPVDKPAWVQRAYLKGYRKNMAGEFITYGQLLEDIRAMSAANSAESAEDTNEGTDGGRQPAADDGVRTGAEDGAGSLPEQGLDGGVGDGAAEGSEGD